MRPEKKRKKNYINVLYGIFRVHLAPVAKKVYFDNKKKFIKTHTRSKNTSCKVNNSFMFKFVLLKPSLHQLIVMMKSRIIHLKKYLIAA